MPWSRTVRNRSGCWPPNSVSRSVWSTPTSSAASRRVWSRFAARRRGATPITSRRKDLPKSRGSPSNIFPIRSAFSARPRPTARTCSARPRPSGVSKVVLAGQSDLAEIAALCAMEHGIEIVGVVQDACEAAQFIGLPVFENFDAVPNHFDAVMVTDMTNVRETCDAAVARFGAERVLVPELLRIGHETSQRGRNMMSSQPRWYVVQTQPNAENKAVAHLDRQGFVTYLPRYLKRRRHARRVDVVAAPLFPRYLFVANRYGNPALAVDLFDRRRVATRVQRRCTDAGLGSGRLNAEIARGRGGLYPARSSAEVSRRRQDPVLDGVFADCLGLYDGMTDSDRVAILLDLLGRKVRVVVDVESVAAA